MEGLDAIYTLQGAVGAVRAGGVIGGVFCPPPPPPFFKLWQ